LKYREKEKFIGVKMSTLFGRKDFLKQFYCMEDEETLGGPKTLVWWAKKCEIERKKLLMDVEDTCKCHRFLRGQI